MTRRRPRGPGTALRTSVVQRTVLDNGFSVVLCPRPHLAQTHLALFFGVGSRHETPEQNGITHLLEHMLFRGTESYSDATALNAAAEAIGGFLEGATYRDHVSFATSCHPSAAFEAVGILGELVMSPRYHRMEVERAILREELLETLDNRGRMVDLDNIANTAIFPGHGLGLPIEGKLENIERISKQELERFRLRYLQGQNGVLSVAGPFDPNRLLARIRKVFGALERGHRPVDEPPPPPQPRPIMRYVRDASSQVDLRLSFRAVPAQHGGYPALVMLGRLLADGLASRMHADLVDRRGLAYSLHAGLTTYGDCGLFEFDVSVAPDRAADVTAAMLDFARSAGRFRFTDEEMQRVRRRYHYAIQFMGDSAADLAGWHGRATLFGVEAQMAALGPRINRLRAAEVRAAAREVFAREGLVLTAVGELARGEWSRIRNVVADW